MRLRGLSRFVGALAVILLVAFMTVVSSLAPTEDGVAFSVASRGPDGRRAAYLLLAELGFEPLAWRRRPAELPRERALLWLPRPPHREADPDDPLDTALARGPHDPRFYRRFVDEGGVLAARATPEMRGWLAGALGIDALDEIEVTSLVDAPAVVELGAYELEVDWRAAAAISDGSFGAMATPLLVTERGAAVAVRIAVGRGEVVLLPSFDFLANERIADADHALLFVRLVEAIAPDGRVLFDEYALGDWERDSIVSLSLSPALRLLSLHALALALLAAWRSAFARSFPRSAEVEAPIDPLQRARAQGALYARARRPDLCAGELRRAAWQRLVDRSGAARALAAREPDRDAVRTLAARLGAAAQADRFVDVFCERAVRSRADLDELERDLDAVSATIPRAVP